MEGREAMSFPGAPPPPFYYQQQRGAFTSISQSASTLHAPPGFRPMSNPNSQHPFEEERPQQDDISHGVYMGLTDSSPAMQPPQQGLPPPLMETVVGKKKRGRPRKHVAADENQFALGLSPIPSSRKANSPSPMSDPNAPKRTRGRPPGTGRKQRLANVGQWMNDSAGLAFAPHVISVEAGEDILSKILSFAQQRPRALCVISGTGMVSAVTILDPEHTVSYQDGPYEILSLGGSYLVNEEGAPKSRTGGISVSLSHPDGYPFGGVVGALIAANLVQIVACSFVYESAKTKAIKQGNFSKEDNEKTEIRSREPPPPSATESAGEGEAAKTPPDFSVQRWSGAGGEDRSDDSRNRNHLHLTDINLSSG